MNISYKYGKFLKLSFLILISISWTLCIINSWEYYLLFIQSNKSDYVKYLSPLLGYFLFNIAPLLLFMSMAFKTIYFDDGVIYYSNGHGTSKHLLKDVIKTVLTRYSIILYTADGGKMVLDRNMLNIDKLYSAIKQKEMQDIKPCLWTNSLLISNCGTAAALVINLMVFIDHVLPKVERLL